MELAKYKACICEGSAEEAIIDILVDNDLLIFKREEMLEECVIRCTCTYFFYNKGSNWSDDGLFGSLHPSKKLLSKRCPEPRRF